MQEGQVLFGTMPDEAWNSIWNVLEGSAGKAREGVTGAWEGAKKGISNLLYRPKYKVGDALPSTPQYPSMGPEIAAQRNKGEIFGRQPFPQTAAAPPPPPSTTGAVSSTAAPTGIEALMASITKPTAYVPPTTQQRGEAYKEHLKNVEDPATATLIEKLGKGIEEVSKSQEKGLKRSEGAAWLKAGAEALKSGQPGIIGALSRAGESLAGDIPKIEAARSAAAEWRMKAEQAQTQAQIQYRKGNLDAARALARDAEQAAEKAKDLDVKIYAAELEAKGRERASQAVEYAARMRLEGDRLGAGATSGYRDAVIRQGFVTKAQADAEKFLANAIKGNPMELLDRNDPQILRIYNDAFKRSLKAQLAAYEHKTPADIMKHATETSDFGAGWSSERTK